MKNIIDFIMNINGFYLVLNILEIIVLNIFLVSKKVEKKKRIIINVVAIIIEILLFNWLNGIINSIFDLKYLSMKLYLLLVIAVNVIVLITINKKIRFLYKIMNYTLFILTMILFGSMISIVIGTYYEQFYIMDISNAVTMIDLSIVIFLLYIILVCLIYIGYDYLSKPSVSIFNYTSLKEKLGIKIIKRKNNSKKEEKKLIPQMEVVENKKEEKQNIILTSEELLNCRGQDNFYINGVECSIIFEDSREENIIKNYHILCEDIHAKLVNGYTLEENQLLKSICMKLNVGNLAMVDIYNISILNKISVEEYNLLKRIFGIQ